MSDSDKSPAEGGPIPGQDPVQDDTRQEEMANEDAVDAALRDDSDASGAVFDSSDTPVDDQLREANDRVLRAQAELENYRRRARREIEDERRYATLPLLQDLLPVVDNLQRAIDSADKAEDISQLVDGIQMVASQFVSTMERHNCQKIAAQGEAFDPNLHEAIAQVPSSEYPAGTIVEEVVTGYQLHDRVIRATQVLVSRPPNENETPVVAPSEDQD